MTKKKGFTLIETLIALAIFMVLIGIVFQTTTSYLRARAEQDAATNAQAKLRRIVEVLTQDIRSTIMGAITDTPYESDQDSVSFALIDGTAYNANRYITYAYFVDVTSLDTPSFSGSGYAMMANNVGDAVIFPVSAVLPVGPGRWRIIHASCQNTIPYTINTLVFPVRPMGIRYDANNKTLFANYGAGEVPYAFNITEFQIDYVYLDNDSGNTVINPSGYNPSGRPPYKQFGGSSGNRYTLQRLRITIATTEESAHGKTVTRKLVSNVDLSNNATYNIRGVVPCN